MGCGCWLRGCALRLKETADARNACASGGAAAPRAAAFRPAVTEPPADVNATAETVVVVFEIPSWRVPRSSGTAAGELGCEVSFVLIERVDKLLGAAWLPWRRRARGRRRPQRSPARCTRRMPDTAQAPGAAASGR
jgi:hypothetical protein